MHAKYVRSFRIVGSFLSVTHGSHLIKATYNIGIHYVVILHKHPSVRTVRTARVT